MKTFFGFVVWVVAVLYCMRQLWSALVYGEVWAGPRGDSHWVSYSDSPEWFTWGVIVYGGLLIGSAAFLSFVLYMRGGTRGGGSGRRFARFAHQPPLEVPHLRRQAKAPPPSSSSPRSSSRNDARAP